MHPVTLSPQSPTPSQLGPEPVGLAPLDTAVAAVTVELLVEETELVPPIPDELDAACWVDVAVDVEVDVAPEPPTPPDSDSTTAVPPQPTTKAACNKDPTIAQRMRAPR